MQGMHYRAIDGQGRVHTGFSSSRNFTELEQWIFQRGWQPLPASLLQRVGNRLRVRPKVVRWDKSAAGVFSQNFAQLLFAGIPLLEVFDELIELESRRAVRHALSDVRGKVDQGESLAAAMTGYPGLFGSDYIASIKAGESSGKLGQCLELQANSLQWQSNLAQRFKTVLTYPLFAFVCLVAVFLFVLLYLVPAMMPLMSMSTTPLPKYTLLLIGVSNVVQESGVVLLLVSSLVIAIGVALWLSDCALKVHVQALLLRGRYGQIIICFSLARYARSAGLLYESGVEITDAMHTSQSLITNHALRAQLADAHEKVLLGESIGAAMRAQPTLPTLFVRMVMAGERAGVLGVALRQCAEQLQSNVQYALDRIERLIGPLMLCVLGAMLLWVVVSVLGPIYDAVGQAGMLL